MASNRIELFKQICPDCTKVMHKRCVNAANDGRDPCKECDLLLCNNCAALVACYDLCEKCNSLICSDCHVKSQKKHLNANFDKKCYDSLCKRCIHVLQCWCVRGIKTHLNELGVSDSSSESDSENSSDSESSAEEAVTLPKNSAVAQPAKPAVSGQPAKTTVAQPTKPAVTQPAKTAVTQPAKNPVKSDEQVQKPKGITSGKKHTGLKKDNKKR